jgi:hypothetical protein
VAGVAAQPLKESVDVDARMLVSLALLLVLVAPAAEAATVLRWGEGLAADHPSVQMIDRIGKRVAETTQQMTTEGAAAMSQFVRQPVEKRGMGARTSSDW